MPNLNVISAIKKYKGTGKINPMYDADILNLKTIINENKNTDNLEMVSDAFVYGYIQGYKAKTAEIKKPSRHFNKT